MTRRYGIFELRITLSWFKKFPVGEQPGIVTRSSQQADSDEDKTSIDAGISIHKHARYENISSRSDRSRISKLMGRLKPVSGEGPDMAQTGELGGFASFFVGAMQL